MSDSLLQNSRTDAARAVAPFAPHRGALSPLGIGDVRIEAGFWADMQSTNASEIIRHCHSWMDRLGWIDNFAAAVEGRLPKDRTGREFSDSDVYKLVEAIAWEVARSADPALEALYDTLVSTIVAAQEPDGYLNTKFGRPGQQPRYSDLEWGHELYCYGHLLQAAVARSRTRGEDDLVRAARRAADHVCEVFGPGGIESVCGHAEVETAMAEFARETGEQRYLDQARLFIERRGTGTLDDIEFGRAYYQDDVPVRDAVRAMYLAAGAIDAAIETGDDDLLGAVQGQLDRTWSRRTYVTGGIGAHHEGESFGSDWELPSERAYSETCASVGSVMTFHRMLLATGEARYGDMIERNLYNVVAASPGADGHSFFYTNTLHRPEPGIVPAEDEVSPRAAASMRAPWFAVSCCPPNVARLLASLEGYVAATVDDTLVISQYAPSHVTTELSGGRLEVEMQTEYPRNGDVTLRILEAPEAGATIALRVPGWAGADAELVVRGESTRVDAGWARAEGLRTGDTVELRLPVRVRVTHPDPRIDALRNQIAVERGPLVLCLERDADADVAVDQLRVVGEPRDTDEGVVIPMQAVAFDDGTWPYTDVAGERQLGEPVEMPLIPYHRWGNNGPSTMRVWLPVAAGEVHAARFDGADA